MGEATGTGGRAGRTAADWILATVAGLVVFALAAALAQRDRALALSRAEADDWAVVNDLTVAVHIDLEAAVDAVAAAAATVNAGASPAPVSSAGLGPGAVLGRVQADRAPDGQVELTRADLRLPELVALLARATDSGQQASSTPIRVSAGLRAVLVAPLYHRGTDTTSVAGRRQGAAGWVVATLDLGAMAVPHLPEGAGAVLSVGDRSFVAAPGAPHADVGKPVDFHGYLVDIRAGALDAAPVGASTWLILGGGLVLAAAIAARVLVLRGRLHQQRTALDRGEAQARLIAEVAPVVQQSLDLADVLPAIAVQLRDHFGLAGIRLAIQGGPGGDVEVFGLGTRPSQPGVPVLVPPDSLDRGEVLALALQRGGRSIARLELLAGRDLHEEELRSLRVLTELVTAAVVNANLYASQQDAVRRLRDLDALKTVFLSTASHELRTPATAIGGFASLLEQRWDSFPETRRREMVERIAANARSLSAVVEDLLDFSLLDRREQPLPTTPTDLAATARGVVERLALLFSDHHLEVQVSPTPPVVGEHNALERVVTNLLTNAAKFSPSGTTVTVEVAPAEGGGRLVVSDQGPGVPEEDRARIFTRFYRGSGQAVVQTRGVGIGLSVVTELVARLGGHVVVDDAPGGGARFEVWLPAWGPSDGHLDGDVVAEEEVHRATTS